MEEIKAIDEDIYIPIDEDIYNIEITEIRGKENELTGERSNTGIEQTYHNKIYQHR